LSATRLETVDRAANDLGVLRLGQSLQSADQTRINQAYDEVYAQLKEEGLATWTSTAAVPNEIVPHMAALICRQCTETYSLSNDRYQRLAVKWDRAMPEIRKLTAPAYESFQEAVDY
jgi:hypothetical protein